jgi:hypothetical protein
MQIGWVHLSHWRPCIGRATRKEVDMRKVLVLVVALMLSLASMPVATAHGVDVLRGDFEGGGIPIFDAEAVAARCPAGFEWILQTFGSGELTTDVYSGEFTLSGEHCSRWLTGPPDSPNRRFPGQVGDGELTLATPEGNLVLSYAGVFALQGDLSIPEYTSKVWMTYRVDGGESTGVFHDASGRGVLFVEDQTGYQTGRLVGWLATQD